MQHIADGSSVHVFHNDITQAAVGFFADVQYVDDVRMADRTRHSRFLNKAFDKFAAALVKRAGKNFCRPENAKCFMPYQIDASHSALTEFPDDGVAVDPVARLQIVFDRGFPRFRRFFLKHGNVGLMRIGWGIDHGQLGLNLSCVRGGVLYSGSIDHGDFSRILSFLVRRRNCGAHLRRRWHRGRRIRSWILIVFPCSVFAHDFFSSFSVPQAKPVRDTSSRQYCTSICSLPLPHTSSDFH